jgi:hypothetical protein
MQTEQHAVADVPCCMRPLKPLILICLAAFLAATAARQAQAGTYENRQFGYSIRYPSSLLEPVATHRPEGQAFAALAGQAGFRVFATRLNGRSPQEMADQAQAICPAGRPTYRVTKPRLVAISCVAGDHIVYQKSLLRGDLAITVRGEYPAAERGTWDPVVTSIAHSMSAAPLDADYPG